MVVAGGFELTILTADLVFAFLSDTTFPPWEWAVAEIVLATGHYAMAIAAGVQHAEDTGPGAGPAAAGDTWPAIAALEVAVGSIHALHAILALSFPPRDRTRNEGHADVSLAWTGRGVALAGSF